MKKNNLSVLIILASVALLSLPCSSLAQDMPEKLETPNVAGTFTVLLTDSSGAEKDLFNGVDPLYFDINFTLAGSVSDRYPVRLTLIQERDEEKEEVAIWEGNLQEGYYRFRYPYSDFAFGYGDVNATVVLKVRIFTKKFTSESHQDYRKWQGTYRVGKH